MLKKILRLLRGRPGTSRSKRPVPRRPDHERALCDAIDRRLLIQLLYEKDVKARVFAAYALFHSKGGAVCVSGYQAGLGGMRVLEVGRIQTIAPTEDPFTPDPGFDLGDPLYSKGVICSV